MPDRWRDEPTPIDQEILSQTFEPIGQILNQRLERPIFFLTLHPTEWSAQYYGILGKGDEKAAQKLRDEVAEIQSRSADGEPTRKDLKELQRVCEELLNRFQDDDSQEHLHEAAIQILYEKPVPLGYVRIAGSQESPDRFDNWSLPAGADERTKTWFQRSLDFAHRFNLEPRAFEESIGAYDLSEASRLRFHCGRSRGGEEGKQALLLEVTEYMTAEDLVDEKLFEVYLAEYLYGMSASFDSRSRPEDLSHFFIPLSGLGQWRAAVCWVDTKCGLDRYKETLHSEISPCFHEAARELCSQALIDVFASQLSRALLARSRDRRATLAHLSDAFAHLWWATAISFFDRGNCCYRRVRNQRGELRAEAKCEKQINWLDEDRFLAEQSCQNSHKIQMNFMKLSDGSKQKEMLGDILPFDGVEFEIPLFDAAQQSRIGLRRYELQLKERIGQVFAVAAYEKTQSRVHTLEAVSHTMKNAVKSTGWRYALKRLKSVVRVEEDAEMDSALNDAIRSLSLFQVVEAVYGLRRLDSLCQAREYGKLAQWTDPGQVARWNRAEPEVFNKYVDLMKLFIALVCHGNERDSGYLCRTDPAGEWQRVSTANPHFSSVLNWIREHGALPPLASDVRGESHTVLLSVLVEPVVNAVTHGRNQFVQGRHKPELYITFENRLPEYIGVSVANPATVRRKGMPPGLAQSQALVSRTNLATIEESYHEGPEFGSGLAYSVNIFFHPIRLAEAILKDKTKPLD